MWQIINSAKVVQCDETNDLGVLINGHVTRCSTDKLNADLENNGQVGYVEYKTIETVPPTVVLLIELEEYIGHNTGYHIPFPDSVQGEELYAYLNDSKYRLILEPYYGWYEWTLVSGPNCFYVENFWFAEHGTVEWCTHEFGPAPESITVRYEEVHKTVHHIAEQYLPKEHQGLPQKVEALSGGEYVALKTAEYEFDVDSDIQLSYVTPDWDPSAFDYLALGKKVRVHVDGVDYMSTVKLAVNGYGCVYVGNPILDIWKLGDESLENTSEPFLIFMNDYGDLRFLVAGANETHTIGVSVPGATAPMSNVVDLDAFGIGQAVLSLYAQGGGTTTLNNPLIEQFWLTMGSISIGKEVRLQLDADGAIMDCGGVSRGFAGGELCALVCFGFLLSMDGVTVEDIKVCLSRYGDSNQVIISVKVTT